MEATELRPPVAPRLTAYVKTLQAALVPPERPPDM
jgi:hypothetical protein